MWNNTRDRQTDRQMETTKIDMNPLIEKGIPAVPDTRDKSPYLGTIGVPMSWNNAVMDSMFGNTVSSESMLHRFAIACDVSWQATHVIIYLVRTRKTSACYDTQGSLHEFDDALKPGENCKWLINRSYDELLRLIARCTKEKPVDIMNLDQSLRHKRSKRDPTLTITTPKGQSFCFLTTLDESRKRVSTWVDVGLSNDLPQRTGFSPVPKYAGPRCHIKECGAIDALLRCSRCKEVFYCTRDHQKMDWSSHKTHCIVANQ